ncbi:MAG: chalcone isomerase family protein [Candidatus Hydrogenedentota bacterium]
MSKYVVATAIIVLAATVMAAEVEEPKTGVTFPASIEKGDSTLCCTGTGYMTKFFVKVFAAAHYGAANDLPDPAADTRDKWKHWQKSGTAKALTLHFVHNVGADRMLKAQREALREDKYTGPNRESYIAIYDRDIKVDDRLLLLARDEETIAVYWNGERAGQWKDPALIDTIWKDWMADNSQVNNPEDLVARDGDCKKDDDQ